MDPDETRVRTVPDNSRRRAPADSSSGGIYKVVLAAISILLVAAVGMLIHADMQRDYSDSIGFGRDRYVAPSGPSKQLLILSPPTRSTPVQPSVQDQTGISFCERHEGLIVVEVVTTVPSEQRVRAVVGFVHPGGVITRTVNLHEQGDVYEMADHSKVDDITACRLDDAVIVG
ncbi:MAG TPA: hypothetical protein VES21_10805 [Nocardioidaceae bacterium]|nr:hypothetical protein [Nocardioidaceae bacterium]